MKIFEGEQFHVGRIEFQATTAPATRCCASSSASRRSGDEHGGAQEQRLQAQPLTYFKIDEDNPIEFEFARSREKTVDLTCTATSRTAPSALRRRWSELDGFFGQLSFQTSNFLGRGENLGVSVQTGKVRDIYELSYFVPWLLDRPQSAGFQLFKRDLDYNLLGTQQQVRNENGGVLTYGRSFGLFHNARLQ